MPLRSLIRSYMIDVVIPLRDIPSPYNDEELRYCLRSIEKYMDVRDVWVVGQPRDWLSVNWIPLSDRVKSRFGSAHLKIRAACDNPFVSDPFVLFNDDFFLLKPLKEFPDYYDGTLEERIESAGGGYLNILKKSKSFSDGKNYATHTPVSIDKEIFKTIPEGISYRIAYGSRSGNEKKEMKDPKIYNQKDHFDFRQWIKGKSMFSTSDFSFNYILKDMKCLYPEPSRWE